MQKNKSIFKLFSAIIICVLCIVTAVFAMQMLTKKDKSPYVAQNFERGLSLSTDAQNKVNNYISSEWGNPTNPVALNGVLKSCPFSDNGKTNWFYLTADVVFDWGYPLVGFYNATTINILLNGYTIAGDFSINMNHAQSKLAFFDQIPGKTDGIYKRAQNTQYYFGYKDNGKGYNTYSTSPFSGWYDTSSMPNFQQNSYIPLNGSTICANNSLTQNSKAGNLLLQSSGKLNFYGVNIIGRSATLRNMPIIDVHGNFNAFGCDFLANTLVSNSDAFINYETYNTQVEFVGSRVYGNRFNGYKDSPSSFDIGWMLGDVRYQDLYTQRYASNPGEKYFTAYMSKIGVVSAYLSDKDAPDETYTRSIYLKDFLFNKRLQFNIGDITQSLGQESGLKGTISLLAYCNLIYQGNSPELTFTLDTNGANLTLQNNAIVDRVRIALDAALNQDSGKINTIELSYGMTSYTDDFKAENFIVGQGATLTYRQSEGEITKNIVVRGGTFKHEKGHLETVDVLAGQYSVEKPAESSVDHLLIYNGTDFNVRGEISSQVFGKVTIGGGSYQTSDSRLKQVKTWVVAQGATLTHDLSAGSITSITSNGTYKQTTGSLENLTVNSGTATIDMTVGTITKITATGGDIHLNRGIIYTLNAIG